MVDKSKGQHMRLMHNILAVILVGQGVAVLCAQFGHKSEGEIVRMTPEQRVQEACREYASHKYKMCDYQGLLESSIGRDGLKALPQIIKILNEYDPTRRDGKSELKDLRCEESEILLSHIDTNVFRLRAYEEGRSAIEAMKRLIERMRAAHFDAAATNDQETNRYQISVSTLKNLEGINACDKAVQNALMLKHKVQLSDKEFSYFVNYMISQDASYPSRCEREMYKDREQLNEAGYPAQYAIEKNVEPFYRMYIQYKAQAR
jgi:hypothetical protein